MNTLPRIVSKSRTAKMKAIFTPVPNQAGDGKVSITGSQIRQPQVKKRKCSSACTELWCNAAS